MDLGLDGRVAVITGAGGGIGRATALELARAGARVVAVDVTDEGAAETARQAGGALGAPALGIAADVTDEQQVARAVDEAIEAFGRIDVLFNNAGVEGAVAPIERYPVDVFDRLMAVNLRGVFLGMKHVLPHMRVRGEGAIVNCSSVSGMRGSPGVSAYIASKHAVLGLTRAAAAEAGPAGIRVNAVCPGPIETRMMHSLTELASPDDPAAAVAAASAKNPMGRWGTPEEVARVVALLASPAAGFVNGSAWTVDGGRTAI